jgi:hypothetical protein
VVLVYAVPLTGCWTTYTAGALDTSDLDSVGGVVNGRELTSLKARLRETYTLCQWVCNSPRVRLRTALGEAMTAVTDRALRKKESLMLVHRV